MEPDYRYDRIKKAEGKKTRDLQEGNGRIQSQKKMRTAIDGSASLIHANVLAFVRLVCACTLRAAVQPCLIFILGDDRQVTLQGPRSLVRCTEAHCVVAACFT